MKANKGITKYTIVFFLCSLLHRPCVLPPGWPSMQIIECQSVLTNLPTPVILQPMQKLQLLQFPIQRSTAYKIRMLRRHFLMLCKKLFSSARAMSVFSASDFFFGGKKERVIVRYQHAAKPHGTLPRRSPTNLQEYSVMNKNSDQHAGVHSTRPGILCAHPQMTREYNDQSK